MGGRVERSPLIAGVLALILTTGCSTERGGSAQDKLWENLLTPRGEKVANNMAEVGINSDWYNLVPFDKLDREKRELLGLPEFGLFFTSNEEDPTLHFLAEIDNRPVLVCVPSQLVKTIPADQPVQAKFDWDLSRFIEYEYKKFGWDGIYFYPGLGIFTITRHDSPDAYFNTQNALKGVELRSNSSSLR